MTNANLVSQAVSAEDHSTVIDTSVAPRGIDPGHRLNVDEAEASALKVVASAMYLLLSYVLL
jgi:hypothetical protein